MTFLSNYLICLIKNILIFCCTLRCFWRGRIGKCYDKGLFGQKRHGKKSLSKDGKWQNDLTDLLRYFETPVSIIRNKTNCKEVGKLWYSQNPKGKVQGKLTCYLAQLGVLSRKYDLTEDWQRLHNICIIIRLVNQSRLVWFHDSRPYISRLIRPIVYCAVRVPSNLTLEANILEYKMLAKAFFRLDKSLIYMQFWARIR